MKPQAPRSPECPTCGEKGSMILVEDQSKFTPLEFVDGEWRPWAGPGSVKPIDAEDARRMFCSCCGEYFQMPEELCDA